MPANSRVTFISDEMFGHTGRLLHWRAVYDLDGIVRRHAAVVLVDDPVGGTRKAVEVGADEIEAIS